LAAALAGDHSVSVGAGANAGFTGPAAPGTDRASPLAPASAAEYPSNPRLQAEAPPGADGRLLKLSLSSSADSNTENSAELNDASASMDRDRKGSELQEADHNTAMLAFDTAALQAGVESFLAGLDRFGAALTSSPLGLSLHLWLLTVVAAGSACEIARRNLKQTLRPAMGHADDPLFGWFPDDGAAESGSRI